MAQRNLSTWSRLVFVAFFSCVSFSLLVKPANSSESEPTLARVLATVAESLTPSISTACLASSKSLVMGINVINTCEDGQSLAGLSMCSIDIASVAVYSYTSFTDSVFASHYTFMVESSSFDTVVAADVKSDAACTTVACNNDVIASNPNSQIHLSLHHAETAYIRIGSIGDVTCGVALVKVSRRKESGIKREVTTSNEVCQGTKTISLVEGSQALITSNDAPIYASNLDCTWLLQAPANSYIRINFTSFVTEYYMNYKQQEFIDSVTVSEDSSIASYQTRTFYGTPSPLPVVNLRAPVSVRFSSNYGGEYSGFKAVVSAVQGTPPSPTPTPALCKDLETVDLVVGDADMSGGGGTAPWGCTWLLRAPSNSYIRLQSIQLSFGIFYGHITISEGSSVESDQPLTIQSATGAAVNVRSPAFVRFYWNSLYPQYSYFTAVAIAVQGDLPTPTPGPALCDGAQTIDVAEGSDALIKVNILGTLIYHMDCSWLLQAPPDSYIRINFTSFAFLSIPAEGRITLSEGSTTYSTQHLTYMGQPDPLPVVNLRAPVFMTFSLGYTSLDTYFTAVVSAVQGTLPPQICNRTQTINLVKGSEVVITSNVGPKYASNSDCTWLLQPPTTYSYIRISFTSFVTQYYVDRHEERSDFVIIAPEIGSGTNSIVLKGTLSSLPVLDFRGPTTVWFQANNLDEYSGFSAVISVVNVTTPTPSPTSPITSGSTFGDPHVKTFGGTIITYTGECDVTMLAAPSIGLVYQNRFHSPEDAPASWTIAAALQCHTNADVIEIHAVANVEHDTKILINKKALKWLEIGEEHSTDSIWVLRTGGGRYSVACSDNSFNMSVVVRRKGEEYGWMDVHVFPGTKLLYKAAGLLGSYDGRHDNDVAFAHGKVVELSEKEKADQYMSFLTNGAIVEVGESWHVQAADSLFTEPHPTYAAGSMRKMLSENDAERLQSDSRRMIRARNICSKAGLVGAFVHSCAYDLAMTGDDAHVAHHIEAMKLSM